MALNIWQIALETVCGGLIALPIQVFITTILGAIANPVIEAIHGICGNILGAIGGR